MEKNATLEDLEEIGGTDIMKGVLLLKPDRKPFRVEDLMSRFRKASKKYSRLESFPRSGGTIDNFFFFFNSDLCYDLGLPEYRLSDSGFRYFQEEFNSYSPRVQEAIKKVAKEVWK